MPKYSTNPILYDKALQISVTALKNLELLQPNSFIFNILYWGYNQGKFEVFCTVDTQSPQPYVEFYYTYQGQSIKYKVGLLAVPSNLGKGKVWFFVCPITNKRCRKLYFGKGYFLHRTAFKNGMYYQQTQSKFCCKIDKLLGCYWALEDIEKQLNSKYFKTHYAGKPTKKYVNLLAKEQTILSSKTSYSLKI